MSRLVSERDQLMADINRLTTRLQGASMDQVYIYSTSTFMTLGEGA